jgi:hypothetical protein
MVRCARGTLHKEQEYRTERMNQLDKDGLRPVMTALLASGVGGASQAVCGLRPAT